MGLQHQHLQAMAGGEGSAAQPSEAAAHHDQIHVLQIHILLQISLVIPIGLPAPIGVPIPIQLPGSSRHASIRRDAKGSAPGAL